MNNSYMFSDGVNASLNNLDNGLNSVNYPQNNISPVNRAGKLDTSLQVGRIHLPNDPDGTFRTVTIYVQDAQGNYLDTSELQKNNNLISRVNDQMRLIASEIIINNDPIEGPIRIERDPSNHKPHLYLSRLNNSVLNNSIPLCDLTNGDQTFQNAEDVWNTIENDIFNAFAQRRNPLNAEKILMNISRPIQSFFPIEVDFQNSPIHYNNNHHHHSSTNPIMEDNNSEISARYLSGLNQRLFKPLNNEDTNIPNERYLSSESLNPRLDNEFNRDVSDFITNNQRSRIVNLKTAANNEI